MKHSSTLKTSSTLHALLLEHQHISPKSHLLISILFSQIQRVQSEQSEALNRNMNLSHSLVLQIEELQLQQKAMTQNTLVALDQLLHPTYAGAAAADRPSATTPQSTSAGQTTTLQVSPAYSSRPVEASPIY